MIGDLPPGAESAYRRYKGSLSELEARTSRFRWMEFGDTERVGPVDEDTLARIAADPDSSEEIKFLAGEVARGNIAWQSVVEGRILLPPELQTLSDSGVPFAAIGAGDAHTAVIGGAGARFDDEEDDYMPESWRR